MPTIHHRTCHLCEANCGLLMTVEGRDVLSVKGDPDNALSRGHICPKATAIADLQNDPDRLRKPQKRTGETWEEVEGELGMAAGTLSQTMAFYNAHAREGRDPLFDKRPPILMPLNQGPFVALELNFEASYFSFFTLGGLRTSPDGEVLDRDGAAIPGLFAAGRCTSGLPAWGHGYSSGLSLADCTFFGRQAGRKAATS